MKTKFFFLTAVLFAFLVQASAQPKKMHQKARVTAGINDGSITRNEAGKIREERKEAKEAMKDAKADGTVTTEEKKQINEERREVNKTIKRSKHNNKSRG